MTTRIYSKDHIQTVILENAHLRSAFPDPSTAEERVFFPATIIGQRGNVVVTGMNLPEEITNWLAYPDLKKLVVLERNSLLREELAKAAAGNPRVEIVDEDLLPYIKRSPANSWDVVVIEGGLPWDLSGNRLFTLECFRRVQSRLTREGTLIVNIASSATMVGDFMGQGIGLINATLREVFPDVLVLPGGTVSLIASRKAHLVPKPAEFLAQMDSLGLNAPYVKGYLIYDKLRPDASAYLQGALTRHYEPNRILQPQLFALGFAQWWIQGSPKSAPLLRFWRDWGYQVFLALVAIALLVGLVQVLRKGRGHNLRMAWLYLGFGTMACEGLLLLAYQSRFGLLFGDLSILLCLIFGGMALGAFYSAQVTLSKLEGRLALLGVLPAFVWGATNIDAPAGVYFILAALLGIVAGRVFAGLTRLAVQSSTGAVVRGYGLDILGGAVGLVAVTFLLPVNVNFSVLMTLSALAGVLVAIWGLPRSE